jgi:hypothetical protein
VITEALRLLITADSAGAVRSIEQVGKTADRELSRSEKSLDRWGNRLTSVGSGLLAFGAVAAYGLGQAARSAGELEQAVGGTEAVFGEAGAKIDEYAKGAAESVGLSQAAFRNLSTVAGAQLKNLGFSVDEAADKSIQLTEIGADLAATYGGTTQEAVEALGAAFRGEADPAERFGLRLNINTANAKAVAMGLAESTSAVDDHARAQAILALIMEQSADAQGQFAREGDTLAGQQQRLAAQFEDLKASIGEGAIPVMKTLADVTSTVVGSLSDANAATGGFLGQAATIATVGALASGGLSLVVGQALKMHQTFSTVKDGTQALVGRLGGLKGAAATAAGVAGLAGLVLVAKQLGDAADQIDVQSLADSLTSASDSSRAATDEVIRAVVAMDKLDETFASLLDTSVPAAERFLEQAEALGITEDQADGLRAALEEKRAEDVGGAAASSEYAGAVDEQAGALEGAAGATDNATDSLETYSDKLKSLLDPLFGAVSAANGLRDANQAVAEKTAALVEAEAQYGAGSAEATAAALALSDAQFAASEAAFDQESALLALKGAVDDGTVSVSAAKAKLAEWVAQGWITQASADATAAALDGVTWSAGSIPDGKTIVIGIDGAAPVIGQLDAIARRVNALAGGSFRVSVGGGGGLTMHTGGIVPGPRGQEVAAVLQAGEGVISIPEMDKLTSGAGGAGGLSQDVRMSAGAIVRQIVSLDGTVRYVGNVINRSIAHATNLITGKGPRAENWADPISEFGKQAYLRMYGGGPLAAAGAGGAGGGGKVDVGLHVTGTGGFARWIHEEVRDGRIQLTVNGSRVRAA